MRKESATLRSKTENYVELNPLEAATHAEKSRQLHISNKSTFREANRIPAGNRPPWLLAFYYLFAWDFAFG